MVKLRLGEKRILMSVFETANSILKLMEMRKKEAIKYMMTNHKEFKKCIKYVQGTVIDLLPDENVI